MTVQNIKSGTEVAQYAPRIGHLSKTHQDYWAARLRKRTYAQNGKTIEIPNWQVRIAHLGRREWFNLQTPNKAAAAIKAKNIYLSLVSSGWGATLATHKPEMVIDSEVAIMPSVHRSLARRSRLDG